MKETWQVILAGEGGQGLITAGALLGEAASIFEQKIAAQTQSYGIAIRGGFTRAEVVIGPEEIIYPGVENPDLVLALTGEAYRLYAGTLPQETILCFDSGLAAAEKEGKAPGRTCHGRTCGFPFAETARDLGRMGAINLVALGTIIALTKIVKVGSMEKAIGNRLGSRDEKLNLEAYYRGLALAEGRQLMLFL